MLAQLMNYGIGGTISGHVDSSGVKPLMFIFQNKLGPLSLSNF